MKKKNKKIVFISFGILALLAILVLIFQPFSVISALRVTDSTKGSCDILLNNLRNDVDSNYEHFECDTECWWRSIWGGEWVGECRILDSTTPPDGFEDCIPFTDNICVGDESHYACQGDGFACQVGYNYYLNAPIFEYYCSLNSANDFVRCEEGCDPDTGLCNEGFKECTEGFMRCGTDDLYDPEGNVYKCVDYQWELDRICLSDETCVEETADYARCSPKCYYVANLLQMDCKQLCTSTPGNQILYDTLQECENSLGWWCSPRDKIECRFEQGAIVGCNDNELSFRTEEDCVNRKITCPCWIWTPKIFSGEDGQSCMLRDLGCEITKIWNLSKWYILGIGGGIILLIIIVSIAGSGNKTEVKINLTELRDKVKKKK